MATNEIATRRDAVRSVIGGMVIPASIGFVVFGPGLTGEVGFLLRVMLGVLWVLGGIVAFCMALISHIVAATSHRTRQDALGALAGYGLIIVWLGFTYPTQGRITNMINHNIPVGSSKAQVKTFLDSNKIFNQKTDDGLSATLPDGIINSGESAFIVDLHFDRQGKLRRFEVNHWQEEDD